MGFTTQDYRTGRKLYHVGLSKDCPLDQARAGGFRLHKQTERVDFDRHGDTVRSPRLGQHVWLSDRELEALREGVQRSAVRQVGAGQWVCVSTGPRGWVTGFEEKQGEFGPEKIEKRGTRRVRPPEDSDVPLATYVYCEAVRALPEEDAPEVRPFAAPAKADATAPKKAKAEAASAP